MIPDLQASILCDDVRQERNGKFILIGIFDGLMQPPDKTVCAKICLVNRWCTGTGEFTQLSRIMAPDGITVVGEGRPVPIRLANNIQVATTVEVFINLDFPEAGIYWIEVLLDKQLRMRYPLHVRKGKPAPPAKGQNNTSDGSPAL